MSYFSIYMPVVTRRQLKVRNEIDKNYRLFEFCKDTTHRRGPPRYCYDCCINYHFDLLLHHHEGHLPHQGLMATISSTIQRRYSVLQKLFHLVYFLKTLEYLYSSKSRSLETVDELRKFVLFEAKTKIKLRKAKRNSHAQESSQL